MYYTIGNGSYVHMYICMYIYIDIWKWNVQFSCIDESHIPKVIAIDKGKDKVVTIRKRTKRHEIRKTRMNFLFIKQRVFLSSFVRFNGSRTKGSRMSLMVHVLHPPP